MHTIKLTPRQRAVLITLLELDNKNQRYAMKEFARSGDDQERAAAAATIAENEALMAALQGGPA